MATPGAGRTRAAADLSVRGLLLDIDRFASHDGPGIRTAVFLKGCPLSCEWCHSPESRRPHPELLYQPERCNGCALCPAACPEGALSMTGTGADAVAALDRSLCTACGKCVEVCYPGALRLAGTTVTVGEVVSQVARDAPYFGSSGGGVTLSGGEPARQFDFSYNFLLACRERGIHTALETTGYARWEVMSALASVTDLLLFDVKFVDPEAHRKHTGVPNDVILENLGRLAAAGQEMQVRVPCISGVNDAPAQVRATSELVAGLGIRRIALLPYNAAAGAKYEWLGDDFPLGGARAQSEAEMATLAEICRAEGLEAQVGG